MSLWLVLDTSGPVAVVGIAGLEGIRAEVRLTELRRHAEALPGAVGDALATAGATFSDLRGVGVGIGPGSFIGVRVGLSYAKGLCLGRGLPLVGLPSLEALVRGERLRLLGRPAAGLGPAPGAEDEAAIAQAPLQGEGAAIVDAKRGEVYVQRVRIDGEVHMQGEPVARSPEDAAAFLAGAHFGVGSGAALVGSSALRCLAASPSAAGLAEALHRKIGGGPPRDETHTLIPLYCRAPDAKLPAAAVQPHP